MSEKSSGVRSGQVGEGGEGKRKKCEIIENVQRRKPVTETQGAQPEEGKLVTL